MTRFIKEWIPINTRKNATFVIDWSPEDGGMVRAKWIGQRKFSYNSCSDVRYAVAIGERLLDEAKKESI